MGSSITTWENVSAYFTFADNPFALVLFAIGTAAIIAGLIISIIRHENAAFEKIKQGLFLLYAGLKITLIHKKPRLKAGVFVGKADKQTLN